MMARNKDANMTDYMDVSISSVHWVPSFLTTNSRLGVRICKSFL